MKSGMFKFVILILLSPQALAAELSLSLGDIPDPLTREAKVLLTAKHDLGDGCWLPSNEGEVTYTLTVRDKNYNILKKSSTVFAGAVLDLCEFWHSVRVPYDANYYPLRVTSHYQSSRRFGTLYGRQSGGTDKGIYRISPITTLDFVSIEQASGDSGVNVIQEGYVSFDTQLWRLVRNNSGYYSLFNVFSGKAMDVVGNYNGANIEQHGYHGRANQQFKLIPDRGAYRMKARHSGKYVDLDAVHQVNIQQWAGRGGPNQVFWFYPQ